MEKNKKYIAIYNLIDSMFDLDTIRALTVEDTDWNIGDYSEAIKFYNDNYDDLFRWYSPEYWSDETSSGRQLAKDSPILDVEVYAVNLLINFTTDDSWKPVLKDWFENKFNLEVKTVRF